ncbi:GAG-pre-integrase domain-containing protein, partial [Pelagicoccus mobilis]|uniref:GAG-pre-integrase domain-containing protein n=1 Tax=Pelagicoccus mobilis TaxID=415221 RepID=UPI0035EC9A02
TNHVCSSLQRFKRKRKLNSGEVVLRMGKAGVEASAEQVGDVRLYFSSSKYLELEDVLYVPSFRRNLVSVSCLQNKGYSVSFKGNVVIKRKSTFICDGRMLNGLYILNASLRDNSGTEVNNTSSHKRKEPSTNLTNLWHLRLGHIGVDRIQRLVKAELLSQDVSEAMSTCESCIEGKM